MEPENAISGKAVKVYEVTGPAGEVVARTSSFPEAMNAAMEAEMHRRMSMLPKFTATRGGLRYEESPR